MITDWAPFVRPLTRSISITTSNIRLNFPVNRYTISEPVVLVTVNGGTTNVTISSPKEQVNGLGEVHTHVNLVFPETIIGLTANVWIAGA